MNPMGRKPLSMVYGGSPNVGGLAVKYAVSAGYHVVTTSSLANEGLVARRSASNIIDHTQPRESIPAELQDHGPYKGIFHAIGSPYVAVLMDELLRDWKVVSVHVACGKGR
jgi:NADPH:quinone reductase-like Zn-dependent oxidoreductase